MFFFKEENIGQKNAFEYDIKTNKINYHHKIDMFYTKIFSFHFVIQVELTQYVRLPLLIVNDNELLLNYMIITKIFNKRNFLNILQKLKKKIKIT